MARSNLSRNAGELDRALPHEDLNSPYIEDAVHWLAVYEEMITFKDEMLRLLRVKGRYVDAAFTNELRTVDIPFFEGERVRLERRRAAWKERHAQLTAEASGSRRTGAAPEPDEPHATLSATG
ncbi:MAG: hypothetical protein ABR541_09170 [Candidatus Dormibacteria bacterium]